MSEPHDRPTPSELIDAVREFLQTEAMPVLDGRLAFLARVAANALGIASRELALGPAHAEAHRARLAALGFANDAELARAIRNGDLDDRYEEVAAAVRAAVRDKTSVATEPGLSART